MIRKRRKDTYVQRKQNTRKNIFSRFFIPVVISRPRSRPVYKALRRSLDELTHESVLMLLMSLPVIILSITLTAVSFYTEYLLDPWGAVYEYRPMLGNILSSFVFALALAILLDLFDKRAR